MKTITVAVYQFDELSERAKEKARQWFRESRHHDNSDFDYTIEDADRMAAILGLAIDRRRVPLMNGSHREDPAIYWQLGYMQSDGVWIEGRYSYAKGASKAIRIEAPEDTTLHELADRLQAISKQYRYTLTASFKDDDRNGMTLDMDHDHGEKQITEDEYKEFRSIVRDFEQWVYKNLRSEDDYRDKDETVDEDIRSNEYEFTKDGERWTE